MKIIETNNYIKLAGKIPKRETTPYNPWAVCTDRVGREDKKNYEKCVQHVKEQNRKENENSKPAMEGQVYSPKTEDEYLSKNKGKLHRKGVPRKQKMDNDEFLRKFRKTKYEPQYAEKKEDIKESADKGWPKKLKKGRFTEWCKRNGFSGPSRSCADKAMNSDDASVRGMASFYINTTLKKK